MKVGQLFSRRVARQELGHEKHFPDMILAHVFYIRTVLSSKLRENFYFLSNMSEEFTVDFFYASCFLHTRILVVRTGILICRWIVTSKE
jgi:hypothetical protein